MATFGTKIREARKSKKMTQKQLADKIGAAHNSISDWENDKNKPDPDTIELLCGVLEITPNYLLTASSSDDFSPSEKLLIRKYRSLDTLGQKIMDYLLDREVARSQQIAELEKRPAAVIEFNGRSDVPARVIKYFHSVSAGTGQVMFDDVYSERVTIPDIPEYRRAAYAVKVSGRSMEPLYCDGDMLLIEPACEIEIGEIGIFNVGGQAYVKKLGENELISLNEEYANIPLEEDSRCMGRVIDKYAIS